MARSPVIGVMGPGETATPEDLQAAFELGQQIAIARWILLTGGRNTGVMDAASRGAKSANGFTVGVLPGSSKAGISAAVDLPILTGMGSARNAINVLSSDVVVACGMGAGTASEVALAIKAQKPVVLLNVNATGQQFFGELAPQLVQIAMSVEGAIAQIKLFLSTGPM
ncbi:MAG TPA: cytochrome [Leptolyngbyaceae cyanobacterium M33_DOE_097]|uniref:Cytochrome n=1 Tax=Oscillatoriales cyanobacterium SpSt-418 TaxID=2282169 RepID=A0A7C3PH93_9CYAN|nr:cytochrome [Leptolyngbyaceae cyanobacterium M33_DOE_097]